MRSVTLTKALVAASANNISLSQSLAGDGSLLINGSTGAGGVATLDTQRRILITSAGNDSGLTWTVIGTNDNGAPIKDSFAGGNIAAVASNLDFLTVTSITGSAATAGAVTAGTNAVGSTPWQLFADTIATPNLGIDMQLAGSGNATFEYTDNQFLAPIGIQSAIAFSPNTPNPSALPHPDLQSLTASKDGALTWVIHGWRLTINSGTGSWTCTTRQAGLASP